jgi:hypothetical protein
MAESAQYAPLLKYLKDHVGCSHISCVGSKKTPAITLEIPGPNKRIPDLIAARQVDGVWRTYAVEAKKDTAGNYGITHAINQLDSIRPWIDRLYFAVPKDTWRSNDEALKDQTIRTLTEKHIGLLTVALKSVEEILEAQPNRNVRPENRQEILTQLGIGDLSQGIKYNADPLLSLGVAQAASNAINQVQRCLDDELAPEWDETFKKHKTMWPQVIPVGPQRQELIILGTAFEHDNIFVQGDPLGLYVGDAQPCIWIWYSIADLWLPPNIPKYMHYYLNACNSNGIIRTERVADVNLDDWLRRDFKDEISIGYRVAITNRSSEGLRQEFKAALTTIKAFG